jgi:DNA-binding CsgD family transcriptional regulator
MVASVRASYAKAPSRVRRVHILLTLLPLIRQALGITLRVFRAQHRLERATCILDRIPNASVILRDDSHQIRYANRAAQRVARSREAVTGARRRHDALAGSTLTTTTVTTLSKPHVSSVSSTDVEEETLRELFGLTVTEARVATSLTTGLRVAHAARSLGMSVSTFRWHLRHVFAKTCTRRQPQLISLLLSGVGSIDRV